MDGEMAKAEISTGPATAEAAIEELFDSLGPRLHALGRKICRTPDEADDLVQETFLRAFRKWDQFEGRTSAASWLYTIATRVCWRMHRRRAGQPSTIESLSELLPSGQSRIAVIPSEDEETDALLWRNEARQAVESAIVRLPLHFRLPLLLKDLAELPVEDVARILGLKEATVKTRVHRARLSLRKALAAGLPKRSAPEPSHSRQVCLDLLRAKQEALDRGLELPVADAALCERCRSVFATLGLSREICREIGRGRIPKKVRQEMEAALSGKSSR